MDERNARYLRGMHNALLRKIWQRADLRRAFLSGDREGKAADSTGRGRPYRQAMAVYKCEAQEFLKSMITLLHVLPCAPLRAPKLLSTTYANRGGRRHSILV